MSEPALFKPYALHEAPIVRESRLIRDLSMPERDWSRFDSPPDEVRKANVAKWKIDRARHGRR